MICPSHCASSRGTRRAQLPLGPRKGDAPVDLAWVRAAGSPSTGLAGHVRFSNAVPRSVAGTGMPDRWASAKLIMSSGFAQRPPLEIQAGFGCVAYALLPEFEWTNACSRPRARGVRQGVVDTAAVTCGIVAVTNTRSVGERAHTNTCRSRMREASETGDDGREPYYCCSHDVSPTEGTRRHYLGLQSCATPSGSAPTVVAIHDIGILPGVRVERRFTAVRGVSGLSDEGLMAIAACRVCTRYRLGSIITYSSTRSKLDACHQIAAHRKYTHPKVFDAHTEQIEPGDEAFLHPLAATLDAHAASLW